MMGVGAQPPGSPAAAESPAERSHRNTQEGPEFMASILFQAHCSLSGEHEFSS